MGHLERIVDGLGSFLIGDLLIFVVGDSVEKNGSGFVMIFEELLLIFCHLTSGNDLSICVLIGIRKCTNCPVKISNTGTDLFPILVVKSLLKNKNK